jgi:hypothetical protein
MQAKIMPNLAMAAVKGTGGLLARLGWISAQSWPKDEDSLTDLSLVWFWLESITD